MTIPTPVQCCVVISDISGMTPVANLAGRKGLGKSVLLRRQESGLGFQPITGLEYPPDDDQTDRHE
jgi:hypothetical protein